MSDRSLLVVCERFDPNGDDCATMFHRAFKYEMTGIERTGIFTIGEPERADMSPAEIDERLTRSTCLVGPKCAAAIVGAEKYAVPYLVLVPILSLIELAGVTPEEIGAMREIPQVKVGDRRFYLDAEDGRVQIQTSRFVSAIDVAIQFVLSAIAGPSERGGGEDEDEEALS